MKITASAISLNVADVAASAEFATAHLGSETAALKGDGDGSAGADPGGGRSDQGSGSNGGSASLKERFGQGSPTR